MKTTDPEMYARLRELENAGVPVDGSIAHKMKKARRGLEIHQIGGPANNTLFAGASGSLGVLIELAIDNASWHDTNIMSAVLELPFYAGDLEWLERPPGSSSEGYVLTECGPYPFDPSVVLNRRIGRDFLIPPGQSLRGFLLGASASMVPAEYAHRSKIDASLTVFANRGRRHSLWLELMVCRSDQHLLALNPPRGERVPLLDPAARDAGGMPDVRDVRSARSLGGSK